MGILLNHKNRIEDAFKHPFEDEIISILERDYLYECKLMYNDNDESLKAEFTCISKSDSKEYGYVRVTINVNERCAKFSSLEVFNNHRNGIGTALMNCVFDTIRVVKALNNIDSEFEISGWLSKEDNNELHWGRSIPFYERLGKIERVDTFFRICKTGVCVKTAEEFFKYIGNSDGRIIYFV